MADDNSDEVSDFSNDIFTREDLVNALNKMVHEYKKLSRTFEDVKAENKCLKDKSDEASCSQLDDSDSLNIELSKLKMDNESVRTIFISFGDNKNKTRCYWTNGCRRSISIYSSKVSSWSIREISAVGMRSVVERFE
ncbi:hypothetical protein F511_22776 [Dorcoceras hygrometricum]|uniref:Uncharacterized protein n=1 Tax=Dorcoceras hygrometricum TaxID=472368 RepID=A0A2Z7AQ85_9LAMI|nr:hypothetical protein F511_22776 [Dorcoceras hygrometricum]